MFRVFGRDYAATHPYRLALRGVLERCDQDTQGDWAVAFNLMDDQRVSVEEEDRLKTYTGTAPGATTLTEGVVTYFKKEVRWADRPAFLAAHNSVNRIPVTTGHPANPGLHPGLDLVRVLVLTWLKEVYWRNVDHPSGEFRELDGHEKDLDYFRAWLKRKCQASGFPLDGFVDATLRMLNQDRRKYRFHPVWATPWEDFEPFMADGPTRWRQILGVRPRQPDSSVWLILLKYKVYEAGDLCRPNQLHSDWCCCHYPSPQEAPLEHGGYAMDLAGGASSLVREYIHEQTDHWLEHFTAAGRRIGEADTSDPAPLSVLRHRHQELLVRFYGENTRRWKP